jgi:hypothetical protein
MFAFLMFEIFGGRVKTHESRMMQLRNTGWTLLSTAMRLRRRILNK